MEQNQTQKQTQQNRLQINQIQTTDTLDLTDLAMFYSYDETIYPSFLQQTGCRRVYIGSYFCEKYFVKSIRLFLNKAFSFLQKERIMITLVIPIAMGHTLDMVMSMLGEMFTTDTSVGFITDTDINSTIGSEINSITSFDSEPGPNKAGMHQMVDLIDEIVVNDYGMLSFLSPLRGRGMKIIAGRLFFRNYRDPRYGFRPEIVGEIFFPSLLIGKIDAVDLDLVSEQMDFSLIPEELGIHVHYPYVYTTLSRPCEFASSRMPDRMKFRPGLPCGNACMQGYYLTETEGVQYLHLGRGVHTHGPEDAVYSRIPERFAYWPADEFLRTADWEIQTVGE